MIPIEWEKEKTNPTGWYITEKYDGMRLYWSGSNFYTRQGKKLNLPESFARHMPPIALDGELWYIVSCMCIYIKRTQYGLYQDAANLPKISNEEKWKKAVYWIFDSPENPDLPLEVNKNNCFLCVYISIETYGIRKAIGFAAICENC